MNDDDVCNLVHKLVEEIRPILAGKGADIQSAVLADLLAFWVAGHVIYGQPEATAEMRDEMLDTHVDLVRQLVPINAKILGTDR